MIEISDMFLTKRLKLNHSGEYETRNQHLIEWKRVSDVSGGYRVRAKNRVSNTSQNGLIGAKRAKRDAAGCAVGIDW